MYFNVFLDDYQRVVSQASNPRELYICKYFGLTLTIIKCIVQFFVEYWECRLETQWI